jgi:hypothetical protein
MTTQGKLDWEKVSWEAFQYLCIYFTENELPGLRLENYLKQGNDQKGIDLHSLKAKNGKYTFIQCKKEKSLSQSDLTNIIKEFTSKDLVGECSDFILITTADLQTAKSKTRQKELKISIKNDFNIDLEFWDRNYLDTKLQKHYSIVATYFGKLDANEHCHSRSLPPKEIHEPKNYINREINSYNRPAFSVWEDDNFIDIESVFLKKRFEPKKILLLGEAHSGKSVQMQKLLYNLTQSNQSYLPLHIDLKELNVNEVESILNANYGNWKRYPAKDIIIALDGLDEVPTHQFTEQVKYIRAFVLENPNVSLMICCRRLFFDHYEIKNELLDFDIFELRPLSDHSIHKYLIEHLNNNVERFYKKINNAGIYDFLFNPFYLVQLVKNYKDTPDQLSDNKIKILNNFIDTTLQTTKRNIKGEPLKRHSLLYNKTLQKLAFSLQLDGTNSFIDEHIQLLFNNEEKLLLQNSSIINFKNDYWSFSNAMFQEHLAAQYLINLPFEQIINLATNGNQIRKIRTKWIQTISSVFSLIDETNPLFKPLIDFIKNDNIEIIFKTEGTKFTSSQIIFFINSLIEKLQIYNNRLQLISENVIASFINSQPEAKTYCIDLINQESLSTPIKTVFVRALKNVELSEIQKRNLRSKIDYEVFNTKDDFYANQLLELSAEFNLATKEFIEELIKSPLNIKHEFRDGVYQNILKLKLTDDFYDYAINGIPALIEHNQKISNYSSYYFLEMVLASFKKPANAKKLLFSLNQGKHFAFFERSINKQLFLQNLTKNLITTYASDITILFPLLKLIKKIGGRFNKNDNGELISFFDKTNSNCFALMILFEDIKKIDLFTYAYLINESCFDFIFNEFEDGNISIETLWTIYIALDHYSNKEVANKFLLFTKKVTENNFPPARKSSHDEYEKYEKIKKKNDLKFILSKVSFKRGLNNYLKEFEGDTISKEELYIDYNASPTKVKANSLFIYHFIKEEQPWEQINKNLVLEQFEKLDFERFQAAKIIRKYSKEEIITNNSLFNVVENYYYKKIPECKFDNKYFSRINEDGEIEYLYWSLEVEISQIFTKFKFDTPEDILIEMINIDDGGVKNFEHHSINHIQSLSEVILEKLSEEKKEVLKKKILSNMTSGISSTGVLENHIGLCRHLKIYNSTDVIINILTTKICNNEYSSYSVNEIINIYLELNGDLSNLLLLIDQIKDYNSYCFIHLAEKLGDLYPDEIIVILNTALSSSQTTLDRKFHIAHILINLGSLKGLKFIVSHIEVHKYVSNRNLGEINLKKLDVKQVLEELDRVCYLIVDDGQKEIHWTESGQGIIKNWILSLSEKSEDDLILVNNFLIKKSNQLKSKYERYFDLHWYRFLALEKFRDFEAKSLSIDEINQMVN